MSLKVIGIGEVLWDLMPDGPQLGGAPANFACHARALGASASVVSRVGDDDYGRMILERFQKLGLPQETVQIDDAAPTGVVKVTLNGHGVPHFIIQEDVAWDKLMVTRPAIQAVSEADAICFGTLAQRSRGSHATIQQLVNMAPPKATRVFDINLRQAFYTRDVIEQSLRLANVLKLNDTELPVLAKMFDLGDSPKKQIEQVSQRFKLRLVVLTSGSLGSLLYQEGRWSEQSPSAVQVMDTVGAGDAFAAALVMGLLHGMDLDELHTCASEVAGYVCSQAGATPALPQKFQNKFNQLHSLRSSVSKDGVIMQA